MDVETQDLSRRFRLAYGIALSAGILLTAIATLSTVRDVEQLREHLGPGGESTVDAMISGAWLRAGATTFLLLLLWRALLRPMADHLADERRRLQEAEAAQQSVSRRQHLTAQIHEAMDMTEHEQGVHRVVSRAMAAIAPELPAELLLADSSRAHLQQVVANPVAGAPGCGVPSPHGCPAVRRGAVTVFESSEALSACPHLAERTSGPCSAVCVPVSSMGRNLGVLHITGPDGAPPMKDKTEALAVVASQAGARIGNLRAMARYQLQAATDGLTGLSNRRATTELLGGLLRRDATVAVAMVDLDHFKQLNDTFGHEAGDRALRSFADIARGALRDDDILGRWGGEEFLIALPGLDRHDAVMVLERIRGALVEVAERADRPMVTASFGVVDSSITRVLDDAVRLADEALLAAKAQGRDRIVVGPVVVEPGSTPALSQPAPAS